MLQRKIHPEAMTEKHIPHKYICKLDVDDGHNIVGPATSKSGKDTKKLSSGDICEGALTINGGRWIKTDSDCKFKCGICMNYIQLRNRCS